MHKGTCGIDGCEEPVRSRGWCRVHYDRWRRHGDPLKLMRAPNRPTEVVLATGKKVCSRCKELLPLAQFGSDPARLDRLQRYCKDCRRIQQRERYHRNDGGHRQKRAEYFRQYRETHPDHERHRQRAGKLWINYKLTLDEFDALMEKQGGGCAICGGGPHGGPITARKKWLSVDHCHTTGRVRGLLCDNCNIGIGKFKDDPGLLLAAIEYLARTVA